MPYDAVGLGPEGRDYGRNPEVRSRFARPRRRKIGAWPSSEGSPEEVAGKASYVGSQEHKSHPSAAGGPALRSDAGRCAPELTKDVGRNTEALREGIRHRCTSAVFEEGFPKYVWTWLDGVLYEARHIRGPMGTYKGYRLESAEWPEDPENRLNWKA